MRRNWYKLKEALELFDEVDPAERLRLNETYWSKEEKEEVFGHIELAVEAGLISGFEFIDPDRNWKYRCARPRLTMTGHDTLDALQNKLVWDWIRGKSSNSGAPLSWEFIKAAIPAVMKELAG